MMCDGTWCWCWCLSGAYLVGWEKVASVQQTYYNRRCCWRLVVGCTGSYIEIDQYSKLFIN